MRWCIFYSNGLTFCEAQGDAKDAPPVGVIAVVQDHIQPPQVLHQSDFYWWRDGHWWAGDIFGFLDQAARYGATWVKQGEMIQPPMYQDIMARAVALKDSWHERH